MSRSGEDSALLDVLTCIINRLCQQNETNQEQCVVTKFHAQRLPEISLRAYLKRIMTYFNCSSQCFILALIYIDRLTQAHAGLFVSAMNVHRLVLSSMVLAVKFFDDRYYSNAFYAKVGGISTQEINTLELDFLFLINFNLSVQPNNYALYYRELRRHAERSRRCGCHRHRLPRTLLPDVERELNQCGVSTEGHVHSIETRMRRMAKWRQRLHEVGDSMKLVDKFYCLGGSTLKNDSRLQRFKDKYGGVEQDTDKLRMTSARPTLERFDSEQSNADDSVSEFNSDMEVSVVRKRDLQPHRHSSSSNDRGGRRRSWDFTARPYERKAKLREAPHAGSTQYVANNEDMPSVRSDIHSQTSSRAECSRMDCDISVEGVARIDSEREHEGKLAGIMRRRASFSLHGGLRQ